MECNKEEAVRAKDIAEKKMQSKDFLAAKRIALKAQQLYPDLENISQLLTVCEVHCSATAKVNGLEDWYGILQVESTADEVSIKKQYRKLALLLHPDKNKFVGAESAFKMVGEAHRTLTDHSKRSVYDSKRTHFKVPGVQPVVSNAFSGVQQQQPSTFWTFCPFCKIRYQYYRTVMNRPIRCQTCLRNFVAYELNVNVPVNTNCGGSSKQPGFVQQNGFPAQTAFKSNANQFGSVSFGTGFQGNKTTEEKQVDNEKSNVKFEEVKLEKKDEKGQAAKTWANQKQKRSRENIVRSSKDKCNGIDSSDSEKEFVSGQSNGFGGGNKNRKSNRAKANVKYGDNKSDDDGLGSPSKKSRDGKSSCDLKRERESSDVGNGAKVHKEEKSADIASKTPPQNATGPDNSRSQVRSEGDTCRVSSNCKKDSDSAKMESESLSYPDCEFHDFCLDRDASSIKEGQIWALYDDEDGMPRFYAKIIKVSSPHFEVRYTWLEYLPEGQTAREWYKAKFPVGCGNFRLGKTETTTEIGIFSHLMCWEKGAKSKCFAIKPRKGEVWALFNSWSIDWLSCPEKHETYEYEVVEVVSDGAESGGISVVALLKVKGFVSIFTRGANESVTWIPSGEMFRFSHFIPSCRVTNSEIEGIPDGSYELDPGSLPSNFENKLASVTLDVKKVKSDNPAVRLDKCHKDGGEAEHQKSASEAPVEKWNNDARESDHPKSEPPISASSSNNEDKIFHDFHSEKGWDKFKCGQIWALYSDFDSFPKYYGSITAINRSSLEVRVTWLDSCPETDDERRWLDKDLPLSTGKFKLSFGKEGGEVFDTLDAFSHVVDVKETGKKGQKYCIYPQAGQIWALYNNWSVNWEADDLKSCEYDIAQILSTNASKVKVMFLTKVEGYDSVYMPTRENDMPLISEIPMTEMLRFSHQIPSYRLQRENKGTLHSYWELDSESLPEPE